MPIYDDLEFGEFVRNLPAASEADLNAGNNMPLVRTDDVKKLDGKPFETVGLSVITDDPEYVYAIVDASERLLFGIKKESGDIVFGVGIPDEIRKSLENKVDIIDGKSLVDSAFADSVSVVQTEEFLFAVVDSENKILLGIRKDSGELVYNAGKDDTFDKGLNNEFAYSLIDDDSKIIDAVDKYGNRKFFSKVSFEKGIAWSERNLNELKNALSSLGYSFGGGVDYTDATSAVIDMPRIAFLNFSGISSMPASKNANIEYVLSYADSNGVSFSKNIVANAQGNSSLAYPKKNIAIDLLNEDGSSFKLKIGDWVEQDSFHIKAFYTDFFRGIGECGYKLYKEILDSRGFFNDRAWKKALVEESSIESYKYYGIGNVGSIKSRIDDGALCFPMGFPCVVYLNGEFYGLFAFQLKKHRDNYMMDKNESKHIHLDGDLYSTGFFSNIIDWTKFEIRNPKKLILLDGVTEYDGDNPQEIIGYDSPNYDDSNKNHKNTAAVKKSILDFASVMNAVEATTSVDEKKVLWNNVFNLENIVDYIVFSDAIHNIDGYNKNWQWTTWDGVHWFVNAYDLDMAFGASFRGNMIGKPRTTHIGADRNMPTRIALSYYNDVVKARYAELRQNKIIDSEHILSIVNDWVHCFGLTAYENEFKKWTDSPCNNTIVVDSHWEMVIGDDGMPVIADNLTYDSNKQYNVGETCNVNGQGYFGWYYVFKCVASCKGVSPATFGINDSIFRLKKWIDENISNMDVYNNYNT